MAMTFTSPAAKSVKTGTSPLIRIAGCIIMAVALSACSPQATEQELMDRAQLAMDAGNIRAAEIDTRSTLQQNPDNAEARRLLGEIYQFQQNPVAAVGEFERALAAGEDDELRLSYARAMQGAGQGDRLLALDLQGEFASINQMPRYLAVIARAQADQGQLAAAWETMDAALAAGSDDPGVNTAAAFLYMAYAGDFEEARTLLESTVARHPDYADAWSLLGGVQQVSAEYAEAEESHARAVELNSYRFTDRLSLASVRIDQGKTAVAEEQVQRLLANNSDHPGVNYLHARMLVEAGEYTEALSALFKVLNVLPDHEGGLYLSALANINEDNLATARRQLNRLRTVQPNHQMGALLLANLHLNMDEPRLAEQVARDILQADERNYDAMALLVRSLGAQESFATSAEVQATEAARLESISLYERMIEVRPEALAPRLALGAALLQQGDAAAGVAALEAARDLAPASDETWSRLIQAQLLAGNIAGAKEAATAYAEQQPQSARPGIYLARIAQQEGDSAAASRHFTEAEAQLREQLAAEPDDLQLSGLLLNTLMGQGKLEEADTVLAGLPEEAARQPAVLVARGRLALAGDRAADAESLLRTALEESPDAMTLMWLTGAIGIQGRDDEAIAMLQDWLADNPADAMVRNELASSYLKLGQDENARAAYQQVVESAPNNVIVLNNLAWLLREDDPEQALVYIEKASELAPGSPQVMDTYAMVQLALGATQEALALNQNTLDLMPGNPETRYHRAMILRADGQNEAAIQILEALVGSEELAEPQRAQAQTLLAELQGL